MNKVIIFLILMNCLSAWAQDPCNKENVEKLLSGYQTEFVSRVQANDCLIKAKDNGVIGIGIVQGKDKNSFGFVTALGTRYLKQNKKDFFIGKTLLGRYKVNDNTRDGNKNSNIASFSPMSCSLSSKQCEALTPAQNFNEDYCRCDAKDAVYCGEKKWSLSKMDTNKAKCEGKEESFWDDQTCECSEERFCGEKKWSKKKKEREAESCLSKKGNDWNEESCSCNTKLYCGDMKWSLKKVEKEESQCSKKENHIWNPDTCLCEDDKNKIVMCKGKPEDALKIKAEEKSCEDKNVTGNQNKHYSWDEENCRCEEEKITLICDGETVSKKKHDRKRQRCLERQVKDDRYKWNEEKCDCEKEKEEKIVSLCGGKNMSQRRIDRKKGHCLEIKGQWDEENCKCKDPCYDVEESTQTEEEICTETAPKLGDVKVAEISAKICEKAIPNADKEKIKAQCQKEVEDNYNHSPDKEGLKTIALKIKYTSAEQVLCDEKIMQVQNNQDLNHALPANVPTTDPAAFEGDCHKDGGMRIKKGASESDMNKYRPYGKITCDQIADIKAANAEILNMAKASFDEFFSQLNINGEMSAEEMNKLLASTKLKVNLQVIGTANRSNNGTGITLEELAQKRKDEAERVIKSELMKEIQKKVIGQNYQVPKEIVTNLFSNTGGASQAVGPLNPAASAASMQKVLNEIDAPAELKKCASNGLDTKKMYDCSVDYFIDIECPKLQASLKAKFCVPQTGGDLRAELKAKKDVAFLEEFKMFQVGVGLTGETKEAIYKDVGTIEVDCSADITTSQTTQKETRVTQILKVTKPGFFRRIKKDCREERKELNETYGRKNVRKAANQRKNPGGIVIGQ